MSVLTFTINIFIIIVVISRCCVFHYLTGLVTINYCFVIMITIYGKYYVLSQFILFVLMITTGAISISQALMVNQTPLELHMGDNKIGDDGITAIAGSLSNSNITQLDVRWCDIGLIGATSLAAALSSNQNIRKLRLYGNPISLDGAHLIMKTAVDNGVCEFVSISDEYKDDEEIKRMMTILDDRRRQNVRNYVV